MKKRQFPAARPAGALTTLIAVLVASSCRLLDFTPLTVTSFQPARSVMESLVGITVSIQFSRAVDRGITELAFSLTTDGNPVPGRITWADRRTLVFTPFEPLGNNVVYRMQVSTEAEDLHGVDLSKLFAHTFTTKTDFARPSVLSATPVDHAKITDLLIPISITFSKPMDAASVYEAFSISPAVTGLYSMSADAATFTFTPTQKLEWQTEYTASLRTTAEDIRRNALGSVYTTHLFTGTDSAVPGVSSVQSADGSIVLTPDDPAGSISAATGWESTAGLRIAFSQPVITSSAAAAVTISPSVEAAILEKNSRSTTTLTYDFPDRLRYGTTYTLQIARGIEGDQGRLSTQELSYHFTVNGAQTLPPSISSVFIVINPTAALSSGAAPSYQRLLPYGQIPLDAEEYPPGTPVETYFDLYVDLAAEVSLDPLSFGRAFSTTVTNGAAEIDPIAVRIDPEVPAPDHPPEVRQSVVRVYVTLTTTGSPGEVTLEVSSAFQDSNGTAMTREYLLPLNDPY